MYSLRNWCAAWPRERPSPKAPCCRSLGRAVDVEPSERNEVSRWSGTGPDVWRPARTRPMRRTLGLNTGSCYFCRVVGFGWRVTLFFKISPVSNTAAHWDQDAGIFRLDPNPWVEIPIATAIGAFVIKCAKMVDPGELRGVWPLAHPPSCRASAFITTPTDWPCGSTCTSTSRIAPTVSLT